MTVLELLKKDRSYRGYDESYRFTEEQLLLQKSMLGG